MWSSQGRVGHRSMTGWEQRRWVAVLGCCAPTSTFFRSVPKVRVSPVEPPAPRGCLVLGSAMLSGHNYRSLLPQGGECSRQTLSKP